jgi:hypothetical protein
MSQTGDPTLLSICANWGLEAAAVTRASNAVALKLLTGVNGEDSSVPGAGELLEPLVPPPPVPPPPQALNSRQVAAIAYSL